MICLFISRDKIIEIEGRALSQANNLFGQQFPCLQSNNYKLKAAAGWWGG